MARPIKAGLDYFNTDVHEMDEREMIHLFHRYGPSGYCIFQVVRCMIYEKGYYLEASMDSVVLVVMRTIGNRWIKDTSFVERVINYCAELGLFDDDLLRKSVFTSEAIQRAYQAVTARSKADKTKYWLLDEPKSDPEAFCEKERVTGSQKKGAPAAGRPLTATPVSAAKTPVSAGKTSVNPLQMHQRKENKTKENKSKAEESKARVPDSRQDASAALPADSSAQANTEYFINDQSFPDEYSPDEFSTGYADEYSPDEFSTQYPDEYSPDEFSTQYPDKYAGPDEFSTQYPPEYAPYYRENAGYPPEYPGYYRENAGYSPENADEASWTGDPESEYLSATGRSFTRTDRAILEEMHALGAEDGLIAEVIREVGERGENDIRSLRYFMPIVKEALHPARGKSRKPRRRGRQGLCEETSTTEDIEAVLNAEWEAQTAAYQGSGDYNYDD